jgi:hypothetical protein
MQVGTVQIHSADAAVRAGIGKPPEQNVVKLRHHDDDPERGKAKERKQSEPL